VEENVAAIGEGVERSEIDAENVALVHIANSNIPTTFSNVNFYIESPAMWNYIVSHVKNYTKSQRCKNYIQASNVKLLQLVLPCKNYTEYLAMQKLHWDSSNVEITLSLQQCKKYILVPKPHLGHLRTVLDRCYHH
jgi:hypothetical protein